MLGRFKLEWMVRAQALGFCHWSIVQKGGRRSSYRLGLSWSVAHLQQIRRQGVPKQFPEETQIQMNHRTSWRCLFFMYWNQWTEVNWLQQTQNTMGFHEARLKHNLLNCVGWSGTPGSILKFYKFLWQLQSHKASTAICPNPHSQWQLSISTQSETAWWWVCLLNFLFEKTCLENYV